MGAEVDLNDGKMAYSATLSSDVRIEATPSLLYNNLSASSQTIAYAHKDNVYLLSTKSLDGRTPASLTKLPLSEPLHPVNQVQWVTLGGNSVLVVATRAGFSVWAEDCVTKLHSRMLKDCGVKDEDALYHFCRGIAVVPSSDHLLVGTSWGEILVTSCTASASKPGLGVKQPLTPANFVTLESMNKGHKQAITAIVADERHIASADDTGTVVQWEVTSSDVLATHPNQQGFPCTSLALQGDIIIAGYASGHIRVFRCGLHGGQRYLEVEVAGHSRAVMAIAAHPSQPTFASVGEDSALNIWSMPETASTDAATSAGAGSNTGIGNISSKKSGGSVTTSPVPGRTRVLLDMTTTVPDRILTGVSFVSPNSTSKSSAQHVVVCAYDWHHLKIFLGMAC